MPGIWYRDYRERSIDRTDERDAPPTSRQYTGEVEYHDLFDVESDALVPNRHRTFSSSPEAGRGARSRGTNQSNEWPQYYDIGAFQEYDTSVASGDRAILTAEQLLRIAQESEHRGRPSRDVQQYYEIKGSIEATIMSGETSFPDWQERSWGDIRVIYLGRDMSRETEILLENWWNEATQQEWERIRASRSHTQESQSNPQNYHTVIVAPGRTDVRQMYEEAWANDRSPRYPYRRSERRR